MNKKRITSIILVLAVLISTILYGVTNIDVAHAADVSSTVACTNASAITGYTCKADHAHSWSNDECTYSVSSFISYMGLSSGALVTRLSPASNAMGMQDYVSGQGVIGFKVSLGTYNGNGNCPVCHSIMTGTAYAYYGCPHCDGSTSAWKCYPHSSSTCSSGSTTGGHGKVSKCTISGCQYNSWGWHGDSGSYGHGTGACKSHGTSTTVPCTSYTTNYANHTSNGTYQSNETSHWTNCKYCSGTMGTTAHTYGSEYLDGGYVKQKCTTCSYVKTLRAASHTLDFDANGGSGAPSSMEVTYGTDVYVPAVTPTRTGYTFKYWTSTPEDYIKTEITFDSNTYVSKAWIENYYNSGAYYCRVLVKATSGLCLKLPTWTYDSTASDTGQDDIGSWTANNIMTTGSWERGGETYNYCYEFPISNRKNELGETQSQIYVYTSSNAAWNANVGFASLPRYGYSFNPGDLYPGIKEGGTQTFTAQWQPNIYEITLDENHSDGDAATTTFDATFDSAYGNKLDYVPERTGYTFDGWYTNANYEAGELITSDSTVSIASDHTLYAKWNPNPYTVYYNANGGNSVEQASIVTYFDSEINLLNKATYNGYKFIGWSEVPNGPVITSMRMPAHDVMLYAVYTPDTSQIAKAFIRVHNTTTGAVKDYDITDEAVEYSTIDGLYNYDISGLNISGVGTGNEVNVWIILIDHAGNQSKHRIIPGIIEGDDIDPLPPPPNPYVEYAVTTQYHIQDSLNHTEYDFLEERVEVVNITEKGTSYTINKTLPSTGAIPTGYNVSKVTYDDGTVISGSSITLTENTTLHVYYNANAYTLTYNANGGVLVNDTTGKSSTTASKSILYLDRYGIIPVSPYHAERTGYTCVGWYTAKGSSTGTVSGNQKHPSDIYETLGNSTLYAKWEVNSYPLTLEYKTNGGTKGAVELMVPYNTYPQHEEIPNSSGSAPAGYTFVGWSREKDSTVIDTSVTDGSFRMPAEGVTLYAVYKKDISIQYVDAANETNPTDTAHKDIYTFYNKEDSKTVDARKVCAFNGWNIIGWSKNSANKNDVVDYESGGKIYLLASDSNMTLYAVYKRDITISYKFEDDIQTLPPHIGTIYYNSGSGTGSYPVVTLTPASREGYSFVHYTGNDGKIYKAGQSYTFTIDTVLTAVWDKYPEITAYDKYFTLADAQGGEITASALLDKVEVSDREDDAAGVAITPSVVNYKASDFTSLTYGSDISVRYKATDSFGNTVTKDVTVHVVDTTVTPPTELLSPRSIDSNYFTLSGRSDYTSLTSSQKTLFDADGDGYIDAEMGGLKNDSLWKTDASYSAVLSNAMANKKTGQEKKYYNVLGMTAIVEDAASGSWHHVTYEQTFSPVQIKRIKEFIAPENNGLGNLINPSALLEFINSILN